MAAEADEVRPECLAHHRLDALAEARPHAIALCDGQTHTISLAALHAAICRCAAALAACGLGRGDAIALALPRSAASVAWLFAIWRTGAVYMPLEHTTPADYLATLVRHARAQLVIRAAAANGTTPSVECLGTLAELAPTGLARRSGAASLPAGCAYLMYTSGSTGSPKGVLGSARGLLARVEWQWRAYPFEFEYDETGGGEAVAHKTSLGFVDHLAEVVGSVLGGCRLIVLADAVTREPAALLRALSRARASRVVVVPALLQVWLELAERGAGGEAAAALAGLRLVACSGDALPTALCARFAALAPNASLVNLYGSTECTADVTAFQCVARGGRLAAALGAARLAPIGAPLGGVRVFVVLRRLDGDGGASGGAEGGGAEAGGGRGEICVAGALCAYGYLDDAVLSARAFAPLSPADLVAGCPWPAGAPLDSVWLRTGDVGELLAFQTGEPRAVQSQSHGDGGAGAAAPAGAVLSWSGRLDEQLKVDGARVEPRQVEAALGAQAGVRLAAVVGWTPPTESGGDGALLLLAFVQPADDALDESGWAALRAALREALERCLPAHARPSHVLRARALPLTRSGKLDRLQLRRDVSARLGGLDLAEVEAETGTEAEAEAGMAAEAGAETRGLRARVRGALLRLSPAFAELAAAAALAAEPGERPQSAAAGARARPLSAAVCARVDGCALSALGIGSLGVASLVHALWQEGWALPMEVLLDEACSVDTICQHATRRAQAPAGAAAADGAADGAARDELPGHFVAALGTQPPGHSAASGTLSALAHWRADAGTVHEPTRPPLALASAAELSALRPYARADARARWRLGSRDAVAAAPPRWWARANERGGDFTDALADGGGGERAPGEMTRSAALSACGYTRPLAPCLSLLLAWQHASAKCVDASALIVERPADGNEDAGPAQAPPPDAVCYIGSHSGEVVALALASGALLWSARLPDRVEASAAASSDGALVFVGCYDGCVYALHARTGELAWRQETGGEVKATACVAPAAGGGEAVWVGSFDRHVYALRAEHAAGSTPSSAALLLRHDMGGAVYASATLLRAADAPSGRPLVVCASLGGRLVAFDALALAPVWVVELGCAVFASPRVDGRARRVLVGGVDGSLRALDVVSGARAWACECGGPVFATPCVHRAEGGGAARYFASSQAGHLLCVDADGRVLWRARGPGGGHSAPSTAGDVVVIGAPDGRLALLSAETGAELASAQLPGPIHSSPVVCPLLSRLVVGCRDNRVYCFALGETRARAAADSREAGADGDADERARRQAARLLVLNRVLGNLA